MTISRFSLSTLTSLLSEFRDRRGVLHAFEVGPAHMGYSALCRALMRVPGVEFPPYSGSTWLPRPARFRFKGREYQVDMPIANYRVAPVDPDAVHPETEELLTFLKQNELSARLYRPQPRALSA